MDRKVIAKRSIILLLVLGLAFPLSGCRTRTNGGGEGKLAAAASGAARENQQGELLSDTADVEVPSENREDDRPETENASGLTKENPDAARKEFDENAPAEVIPGTDRQLHGEGEGNGAAVMVEEETLKAVSLLNEQAEKTATQTVAAQEAEDTGVSEDAEQAESAMTYFTVLLQDRVDSLFECQRANVYWETAEDHVTVYKSSQEHTLILNAGAYDVSARLLPENLRVDDGWVTRKNPQVIVKIVDSSVLGGGVHSTGAAQSVYQALCGREGWPQVDAIRDRKVLLLSEELLEAPYLQTAAMLMIAKTASPELFSDVDLNQALSMLTEEATGTQVTGMYYFSAGEE